MKHILAFTLLLTPLATLHAFSVTNYGAVGDGKTLCTQAIQKTIDACAAAGGGTVRLTGGTYLSGSLVLKSHVTLHVERGATLLGSPNPSDYPENPHAFPSRFTTEHGRCSLITAEKAENVAIEGRGTIDGQSWGAEMKALIGSIRSRKTKEGMRPLVLRFSECRNVKIRDITLKRSAFWMQNYLACEDVLIEGITVENVGPTNTDGLDLDGCKDVRIANCRIISRDDSLCLKSTSDRPCENVVVTNCILSSRCNAIKCGTDSTGGFINFSVSDCVVTNSGCGISLELVDGGKLERVRISNINMHSVANPIFVRLGNRGRGQETPSPGILRNVIIRNVQAEDVTNLTGCAITGLPDHPVENITLDNIRITFKGGGIREDALRDVPEWPERYPEFFMFAPEGVEMFKNREAGRLPAYGFWVRHARNVRLTHLDLRFAQPDQRPALFFDDAQDVTVSNLTAQSVAQTPALIWLRQTNGALISGCAPRGIFVKLTGDRSRNIALIANDLRSATKPADVAPEVPKDALSVK
ncbi:MAG: glycoside hydrolase family 28 protein [Verrucomicrobia bacterium]|nr:glycoside hydrolase family 28 protein [Verrucomicrobiota bacterium]